MGFSPGRVTPITYVMVEKRAHDEDGFLLIELIAAMLILTVALLALIGAYSLGYFAIGSAAKTSAAGLLANNQLELYSSLPYTSIGLDATTLTSVQSSDPTYSTDEAALPNGASGDRTISGCGSSAQCSPVQTLTGADHKTYKIETFIRDISDNPSIANRPERVVTVIVRNMSVSGSPIVVTMQTAFDQGNPSAAPPAIPDCHAAGSNCESMLTNPRVVNNTTLTIVAMDDSAIQTSGAYAPTAFLNGIQQLPLATSGTSGWPQVYVTSYGGTTSSANQRHPSRHRPVVVAYHGLGQRHRHRLVASSRRSCPRRPR
jgi:type II secretory pathway pseudopilin PulG